MWCPLFLVLLAGAASAEHYQAWKTDTEYQYLIRGRTLAALHDVSDQYTGIILKAVLTVQPKSEGTLQAKVSKAQYARIHTKLPEGWKSEISDSMVDYKQLPLSEKVFEVKMRHGIVRDLIVDKDVPTWEVNVLKSIVSQLQVDTQGENLMPSRYNQEPEGNSVNAMYKTMEDSVGGRCEVMYDINRYPEYNTWDRPESSPRSEYHSNEGEAIEIVKTKNYTNCEQRMSHHFGITGSSSWEPSPHDLGQFMSRSSISRMIITGDLKTFTIESSVTTDMVVVSPNFYENQKGMVGSRINLTLVKMGSASSGHWSTPSNPESTGNLVYNYNNPFARHGEDRRPGQPNSGYNGDNSDERVRYSNVKSEEDDSSASRSSKSVNSQESYEQQQSYWQPKPTLNKAPDTPLLPFFIGYNGKSIQKSSDIDTVAAAKSIASQIGSDLQNPNAITEEQTLEKFTILIRILRTMNTQQFAEVQQELYQSHNEINPRDESQSVRRNTWVAFRDAVAQAGTGPALITIKNLVKEKKIKGIEAAAVVNVLSKTAKTPTPEYMDTFFKMATMPETTSQEFVNSSAIITFAELIRYSQVNHASAHNRYPVHSFGPLSPKHNPAIFNEYIPYMSEKMKDAIENNEFAKSHVYIRALGAVAHPKILAAFEPYLEGKSQASTYQRLLMVMSLNKLADLKPRLARGILYRIYKNTAEAHQLRCAAVTFLMSTNPPASMLQRMAEFTNYDHSKQVNSAVKSAIESASELTTPESQDLANKARNVRSLLNKETYDFEYSKNYLIDYAMNEINLRYRAHAAHIGSEDSFIPQAFYASLQTVYGNFKTPRTELGAMVSSVKNLYNTWKQLYNGGKEPRDHQDNTNISPEKIAKLLNIETTQNDNLEGSVWMNNPYQNNFASFDKHSLQRVHDLLRKASAQIENGHNFNIAKIVNYDVTLSFPMESGLPFLYTFNAPALLKVSGSVKGHNNPESTEGTLDMQLVKAVQIQAKIGFVTPFEHQHYLAGVNKNYQIHLPIRVKVNYDRSNKRATLKLEPTNQNEKNKIMEYSVNPFTSRHDIMNFSPTMKNKETHNLRTSKLSKNEYNVGSRTHGLNIKIQSEGDNQRINNFDADYSQYNSINRVAFGIADDTINYRKIEVHIIPNQSSSQSIIFSASVETLNGDPSKRNANRNEELKARAPQMNSKKLNDPERRKQFLREVAKGIVGAEAVAIDIGVDLPGQEPSQLIVTLAYANSKVDEKSNGLLYSRVNSGRKSGEACIALQSQSPRASVSDMEMAERSSKTFGRFDMELRAGPTCEDGNPVRIYGNQKQSKNYRQAMMELPSVVKCLKEVKKGTKSMAFCQATNFKLSTIDEAEMTIKFNPKDRAIKEVLSEYFESFSNDIEKAQTFHEQNDDIDEDTIKLVAKLDPFSDRGNFAYQSSDAYVVIPDVDIGSVAPVFGNVDPDFSMSERMNMKLSDANYHQHTCVIDYNSVTTFDQATYPIHLGKCWHVAFTTSPQNNREYRSKNKYSENMKVTILVRDGENNKKEVKLALGNAEFKLKSSDDNVQATIDGNNVDFNKNPIHRRENDEREVEFEVLQRPDGSVRVYSYKYDVDVIYDGQHVQIKASGKYRNDARGLCGNYDGEPANDFISPKNCILKRSDEFAASYALANQDCQGPARELSKKAEEATCYHKKVRPGNVVNDHEARRKSQRQSNWGYHNDQQNDNENQNRGNSRRCTTVRTKVVVEDDQICFSLRPVPSCASGCEASRYKSKSMPMYCRQNNSAARQMAERIKKGANPDLSQKEPSKQSSFQIPVSCEAA